MKITYQAIADVGRKRKGKEELTTMIPDEDIGKLIDEAEGDIEQSAKSLVATANARGGEDNITVLLSRFDE